MNQLEQHYNLGTLIYYLMDNRVHSALILSTHVVANKDDNACNEEQRRVFQPWGPSGITYNTCHGSVKHENAFRTREELVGLESPEISKWMFEESGLVYRLDPDGNYDEINVNMVQGTRGEFTRRNEASSLADLLSKFEADSLRDLHDKVLALKEEVTHGRI